MCHVGDQPAVKSGDKAVMSFTDKELELLVNVLCATIEFSESLGIDVKHTTRPERRSPVRRGGGRLSFHER